MTTATQKIKILPPDVVNKIAAGEVVERPSSVVKELVENAIDAGATKIQIQATNGGRNLRIADNGCGMTKDDALLAFTNHATSKIQDATQLDHIATLGFRGEALASISAISQTVCTTRTHEATTATKITFEGTQIFAAEAGAPAGTVFEISDLFYNTPARLKFLKKPNTELSHIEETVQALALANLNVRFELTLQEKTVLTTTGNNHLEQTINDVFRLKGGIKWVPVSFEDPQAGFKITGFVSEPDTQKSSRKWMMNFINGRVVRCNIVNKATETAFESLLPHGKYPFSILFLSLPHTEVDVNVHPTKKEVRYVSPNQVFSFVKQGVLRGLEAKGINLDNPKYQPSKHFQQFSGGSNDHSQPFNAGFNNHSGGGFNTTHPIPRNTLGFGPSASPNANTSQASLSFYQPVNRDPSGEFIDDRSTINTSDQQQHQGQNSTVKVIGQLFNTYILLETPQGLMVVDQHIASERAFFERFKQNTMVDSAEVQTLLASKPITVTASQQALLNEKRHWFGSMGFHYQWTDDSARELTLTAVPMLYLEKHQPDQWFEAMLNQLEQTGEMSINLDDMLATMACHSACRAGDVLDNNTMMAIIDQWLECKLPWTCPHGRPIAHTIAADELNKFFHRPSLPANANL